MSFFNRKGFLALLGCSIGVLSAQAQNKLTLSQCIELAVNQNLQIRQSELQQESTINTYQQTRRNRLPAVIGLFNPGYSLGRNVDPYTNGVTTSQIGTNSMGVRADWTVFNGYQQRNLLQQNALNLSAGQFDVQAAKNAIRVKVLQAYMQVLMAQELLNVSLKQAEASQLQLDRISKQVNLQVVAESNLYNLQAQLANDEIQITNARNDVRLAHMTLGQLLNWPADRTYELAPAEVNAGSISAPADAWQGVYQSALTTLPDVKAADVRIQAAEKGLDIAKGVRYPTLAVSSSFGTSYSSAAQQAVMGDAYSSVPINAFVKVGDQTYQANTLSASLGQKHIGYFDQLGLNRTFSIGLSLRIPIFNATQSAYRVQDAKIQRMVAGNQHQQVRLQLQQQTEQAFVSLQNAVDRYKTLSTQVGVLEKALRVAEVKLTAGVANPLDYTLAKTNLDRAKASFVQVKYECVFRKQIIEFYRTGLTD